MQCLVFRYAMEDLQQFLSRSEEDWVKLGEFVDLLHQHRTDEERRLHPKLPKRSTVLRELKAHKNDAPNSLNDDLISPLSVLRYIFNHIDNVSICQSWGKSILKLIVQENNIDEDSTARLDRTCFSLYKHLSTKSRECINFEISKLKAVESSSLKTLCNEYQCLFEDDEWQVVCWFEYHFTKSNLYKPNESLLQQTAAKWDYMKQLEAVTSTSLILLADSQKCIHNRLARM